MKVCIGRVTLFARFLLAALVLVARADAASDPVLSLTVLESSQGEKVGITLLWTNAGKTALALPASPPAKAALKEGDYGVDAVLNCPLDNGWPASLAPGTFLRIDCDFTLPEGFKNFVAVRIADLAVQPALLALRPDPSKMSLMETPATPGAVRVEQPAPATDSATASDAPVSPDVFRSAVSSYEPVYFSAGSNGRTNARFQISFKFRLFRPTDYASEGRSFADDLYLGFTQTSLWDLHGDSRPFFDTSYRPVLFFFRENLGTVSQRLSYGLEAGIEHESNGKDGTDSRSINIVYVKPLIRFGLGRRYGLMLAPKIYAYLDDTPDDTEKDISDYRGYVDLLLRLERRDYWRLDTIARKGTDTDKGSVEVDFSYPLRWVSLGNLNGYLHLQYFYGYGETILSYDLRFDPQYRIGLMLVR